MLTMIQPVLACGKGTASDVTVFLGGSGTTYDVYIGVALLERVGISREDVRRKMLLGRLYNAHVPLRELSATFGHDPRTIKRWGKALLTNDVEEMARVFAGRSAHRKVTPELIRYGRQLYRERHRFGRNYREVIIAKIAEVFGVTISGTTASTVFASASGRRAAAGESPKPATALPDAPVSSTESVGSVKQSPTPLPVQVEDGESGRQLIHHAGQVLFAEGMKGIGDALQRQFVAQILQGAVNVEQSKTLCGRSLAHFSGPIVSGLKKQRDGLDAQTNLDGALRVYEQNAELLCDGPNRDDLFYFDPHTKEYTGQLRVLKGWCGRRHGVVKAINLDSFHTRSGRPCFIQHYSPYYDMRERFFMSLARFDRLFAPDKRSGRTFVIDRGIYGLAALRSFGKDYVITWEKNYSGDGWDRTRPALTFSRSLPRNSSNDLRTVTFECQQTPWRRDQSFRRIVVRAARAGGEFVEAAVLTSHPDMDMQDIVWAIFRRWLQENDFKYLDAHFGLNELTSRDNGSFRAEADRFEDRPVDSPEYRELRDRLHGLETGLGKALVRLRKQEKQASELEQKRANLHARRPALAARLRNVLERATGDLPMPRGSRDIEREAAEHIQARKSVVKKLSANTRRRQKLRTEIDRIEEAIEPLEARLCSAVRKQSRLHLLIQADYRLLDTRKKAMMDALRITASNIFRNVQELYRAICNDYRDDHVLVRMLSRCSGTLIKTASEVVVELWLPGTLQPHRLEAIRALLKEIEERTNAAIPAPRPVRLRLITGPLKI
ncbi:MAG: hypothetical protein GXP31_14325 [Kiritimatiellaeota bacterium]|nr:hypothetical protein [Kiritimatiellota bacterium]